MIATKAFAAGARSFSQMQVMIYENILLSS
jgi:hypothetical protein